MAGDVTEVVVCAWVPEGLSAELAGIEPIEGQPFPTGTRFYRDAMAARLQALIDREVEDGARASLRGFLIADPGFPLLSILDLPKSEWGARLMRECPVIMAVLSRPVDSAMLRPAVVAEGRLIRETRLADWLALVTDCATETT